MKRFMITLVTAAAMLVLASPAAAATVRLVGQATNEGTHVKLVAGPTTADHGNVEIVDLSIRLGDLQTLSADFNPTDDGCAAGSPRYTLILDDGTVVHAAFGEFPTATGGTEGTCTLNTWQNTGNLLTQFGGCRWHSNTDACLTSAELQALANRTITQIYLVTDKSWSSTSGPGFADNEQTILVRNLVINNQTFFAPVSTPTWKNASKACKAQRAAMGDAAFKALYGTNANKSNAHGKCVSAMNKAKSNGNGSAAHRAALSAAKACKTERAADPAAFRAKYGTNANKSNAFGKCVSSKAKPQITALASGKSGEKGKGKGKGRK